MRYYCRYVFLENKACLLAGWKEGLFVVQDKFPQDEFQCLQICASQRLSTQIKIKVLNLVCKTFHGLGHSSLKDNTFHPGHADPAVFHCIIYIGATRKVSQLWYLLLTWSVLQLWILHVAELIYFTKLSYRKRGAKGLWRYVLLDI